VEAEIRFDGSVAEPVRWDGIGLQVVQVEGKNTVRVVSGIDPCLGGADCFVGVLGFRTEYESADVRPMLMNLRCLTESWEVVDHAGRVIPLTAGASEEIRYALQPVLDLGGNPSSGAVTARFGAPLKDGSMLRLEVFDVRGRFVGCALEGLNDGIVHEVRIGPGGMLALESPGVYFVQLSIDGRRTNREKVVLLK
jgi:hypothetical protein